MESELKESEMMLQLNVCSLGWVIESNDSPVPVLTG